MPDLWSKMRLSWSNIISCTETSHQLGKFHIMNHVRMRSATPKRVGIIILNSGVPIKNVITDVHNSKRWKHAAAPRSREANSTCKKILRKSTPQHRVPPEIKHSREENNPGVITTFPPLSFIQLPVFSSLFYLSL